MFRTWHKALADIRACNCKFCRLTLILTRSPAQKPACKDLGRNGQNPAITPKAAYTPVSDRAGSRSL
ncbi:Alpha-galactosidase [Lacticaseibacillus rhamnosus LRHMDP2]|uniref:Alpha-galactosidase n=1 Tax=Lacticaseibacillus rhamnosus LRHMDP3 TaxID=1203259 RepID=A0AB33XSA2_LACRH|nr:Alpha-galactosidase [Lacticaseibacillus rhamnosus LRHMDP3]EKS53294.1 Alpha-galactosidase [Lacticaseibacillus rhamnosus LRHMDP2]